TRSIVISKSAWNAEALKSIKDPLPRQCGRLDGKARNHSVRGCMTVQSRARGSASWQQFPK
ncbi:LOW QUALITY PROTEIN: hypothetical protein PanWU01x14_066970, partial [Parasponia andersonii]